MAKIKTLKLSFLVEKLEQEHDLLARFELDYWRNGPDFQLTEILKSVPICHEGIGLISLAQIMGIGIDHKGLELIYPRSIASGHLAIMKSFRREADSARNCQAVLDLTVWLEKITGPVFQIDIDLPIQELQYLLLKEADGSLKILGVNATQKAKKLYRLPSSLVAYYQVREPNVPT